MTCVQDCQREADMEKRIAELEAALRDALQIIFDEHGGWPALESVDRIRALVK